MKIALYGMPCAGKSTLMDRITDAKVINGSQELRRICGGSFSELLEEEKHQVRIKYTEYINALNDEVIVSDGHYSFMETVAFTEADGDLYDIFIYLYCSPENLKERYALSEKNAKFAGESIESLRQWQEFEINNLREECHRRNKDFYVVSDNEEEQNNFFDFLSLLREGFSSYDLATDICNQIMEQFNKQDILYMVDGDKTIIIQDSYRFCCNGKTKIFDGDFYTGYQSFLFEKELQTASIDKSKIAEITINNEVYDIVASNNYVVLSSGIKDLWSDIANAKNLDRIGVMYLGNIVELAESQEMFDHPTHPYTEALLSAIPTTDVDSNREMIPLEGDIPSPVHPPKGCKFHTRCKYCTEICKHITPELVEMRPGHFVACHNPLGVEKDS